MRQVISEAFSIPVDAWDAPPKSKKPEAQKAETAAPDAVASSEIVIPEGAEAKADLLESFITGLLVTLKTDPDATPTEQIDIANKAANILDRMAKSRGEYTIDKERIFKHREFKEAVSTIIGALDRPDFQPALEAVRDALRKLGAT